MKMIDVPLIRQNKLTCGVTALRMVLRYFGTEVSANKIIKDIGGIKNYGVRTVNLVDFANGAGFKVEAHSCNKKLSKGKAKMRKPSKLEIVKFLKRGLPVILAVNSSILYNKKRSEMGHFIVVTRYDSGIFSYNDPRDGRRHEIEPSKLMDALAVNALGSSAYLLVLEKM